MSEKICAFTGHREIPAKDMTRILAQLDGMISKLIDEGYTEFRCGGAQGFDTMAALNVLEAKKRAPHIKLALYLPCKNQTRGWKLTDKKAYEVVLANADSVKYCSENYYSGCMHARNRAMIDGSDTCVAYCTSSHGGTAYTLVHARRNQVRTILLEK